MKTTLLAGLLAASFVPASQAVIVVDSFSGAGVFANTANTGDIGSNQFTQSVTLFGTAVDISFDVTVETLTGGDIHFDTRGFGDSGGTNDAAQVGEGFVLTFSPATITNTSGGFLASVTDNLTYEITGANLVNNGANPPRIDWSDTLGGSGVHANAAGTASGNSEAIPGPFSVGAAHSVTVTGTANWWWLNDVGFALGGDVTVDVIPEPSRAALLSLGLGALFLRRRR